MSQLLLHCLMKVNEAKDKMKKCQRVHRKKKARHLVTEENTTNFIGVFQPPS